MMLGYLDNLEATANAIDVNGWLKTGDIGYRRQGLWYVVDRKKVVDRHYCFLCYHLAHYGANDKGYNQSSWMASCSNRA